MHHAQTFSGNRYAKLRNTDYYLGALILYALFAAVFIPYLYAVSSIWTNSDKTQCSKFYDDNNNKYGLDYLHQNSTNPDGSKGFGKGQFGTDILGRPIIGTDMLGRPIFGPDNANANKFSTDKMGRPLTGKICWLIVRCSRNRFGKNCNGYKIDIEQIS